MTEDKIRKAFDEIKADDALKQKTVNAVMARTPAKKRMPMKMILTAAALIIAAFAGIFSYTTPVYAISLDDTASIELHINMYQRVVSVSTYDGTSTASYSVANMSYTDAVQEILSSSEWNNANVVITIAGGNQAGCEKMMSTLQSGSMQCMANAAYATADTSLLQEAQNNGMSLGKYKAYLMLKELDSSVTVDQVQQMTMQEIHQYIRSCKGMNGKGMSRMK